MTYRYSKRASPPELYYHKPAPGLRCASLFFKNEERAGCDPRMAFRCAVKRYAEAGFERTEPADLLPAAIWVTYTVDFRRTRYNYVLLAERAIDRRAASNGYVGIL